MPAGCWRHHRPDIVGFGTSTPEFFTSLLATWRGQLDISVGNVVIFNVAFILGLTALVPRSA